MARIRLSNASPSKIEGFKKSRYINRKATGKLPNGRVGTYSYRFQTYCDKTKEYSKSVNLRFDTFQDARDYVMRNTPKGHQGLLDGESIFMN